MLNFDRAYRLLAFGDEPVAPRVVVGVRRVVDYFHHKNVARYEFIPNHPLREYDTFLGTGERSVDTEVVEVDDVDAAATGRRRTWRFDLLTLETLREMADSITGGAEWVGTFGDDAEVQNYFVNEYLFDTWSPYTGNTIEEALAYPIGTIRAWADGYDHQKQPNGQWVRIGKTHHASSSAEPEEPEPESEEEELDDSVPHGEWVEYAEDLPKSTVDAYFEEDSSMDPSWPQWMRLQPNAERQELHVRLEQQLRRRLMGNVTAPAADVAPVAVLTMGVPASGKTHATRRTLLEGENFVHIDPDEIKEFIPEYRVARAQRAKNAAEIVHEESAYLADRLRDEAVARGFNFVFEGVGRDGEYYEDMIDFFKANGYKVQIVFAHLEDPDTAVARSNRRGEKTGRWVPERAIRHAVQDVPVNFARVADKVDAFSVFDSSGDVEDFNLKLAWAKQDGEEYVVDSDMRDRILGTRPRIEHTEQPTERPPAVAARAVSALMQGLIDAEIKQQAAVEASYNPGEGVTMPLDDGKVHRWKSPPRTPAL